MLKDVGMEVPKSIETRSKFSMHADKGSGYIPTSINGVTHVMIVACYHPLPLSACMLNFDPYIWVFNLCIRRMMKYCVNSYT